MTTDAMTPQALVDALAAMRKPCPNYTDPKTREHWPSCPACNGTGTVALHPWLSEECVGHWTHQETGEHIGPTMDYLQPWRGLKENHGKSASYIQRHGTWCCQGTGQRVRRAETVRLEEVLKVAVHSDDHFVLWHSVKSEEGTTAGARDSGNPHIRRLWIAQFRKLHVWSENSDPLLAALRALYAAEQALRKAEAGT